jgi:hypothetical protein
MTGDFVDNFSGRRKDRKDKEVFIIFLILILLLLGDNF